MDIQIFDSPEALGEAAAEHAARVVTAAITARGTARVVLATGASQFAFLGALASRAGVDSSKATLFHLDDYVGLPADHPASFRRYLQQRAEVPLRPGRFEYVNGSAPDSRGRVPPPGARHPRSADRPRLRRYRREWPPGVQRPARGFRHGTCIPGRDARRAVPAAAGGRGMVHVLSTRSRRARSACRSRRSCRPATSSVSSRTRARRARFTRVRGPSGLAIHPASALQRHPATTLFLDRNSASMLRARA